MKHPELLCKQSLKQHSLTLGFKVQIVQALGRDQACTGGAEPGAGGEQLKRKSELGKKKIH